MRPNRGRKSITGAFLLSACLSAVAAPASTAESGPLLTIDEAVRLALQNNPDIEVEAYAPAIARANVLAALGQFDPVLNFGRSYTRSYSHPSNPGPLTPMLVESDTYDLSLTGALPTGLTYSIGGTAANERGPYNSFVGTT